MTVTTSAGTATTTAVLSAVLPGLFTFGNYVAAIRPGDSTIVNGTGNAITGYSTAAAANPGDVLSLYATGLAATTTSVAPGLVFSGAYPTSATPTVTIGGIAAAVSFSGLVGAGLYQINLTVPATLTSGAYPVVVSVNGSSSPARAFLTVGSGDATVTTLVTSAKSATAGTSVTLTATVAASSATGSVSFYDGANLLGTSALSTSPAATITITSSSATAAVTTLTSSATSQLR